MIRLIAWLRGKNLTVYLSELDVIKWSKPDVTDDVHVDMDGISVSALLQPPNLRRLGFCRPIDVDAFLGKMKKVDGACFEHAFYDMQSSSMLFYDDGCQNQ